MSKTIDNLNKLKNLRANGSSREEPQPTMENSDMQTKETLPQKSSGKNLIFSVLLVILILSLAAVNLKIFSMVKSINFERGATVEKLSKLERILAANLLEMNKVSGSLAEVNNKISNFDKQLTAQAAAVENLTKAKNALFSKMKSLEAGLGKLQGAKSQ